MKKKVKNYVSGQMGEHLVAAELGRRGMIASVLSGNAPDIDILAFRDGKSLPIQVKSIKSGSVSVNLKAYLDIEIVDDIQIIHGLNLGVNRELIFVVVVIGDKLGDDSFFIFRLGDLQDIVFDGHTAFLKKHGGRRPRNPKSMHGGIGKKDFQHFEDNWELIESSV